MGKMMKEKETKNKPNKKTIKLIYGEIFGFH